MNFPYPILVTKQEAIALAVVYNAYLHAIVNPRLERATNRNEFQDAMGLRYTATDSFWKDMEHMYPEIKGMGCGLVMDYERSVIAIVVQGPMATIAEDLKSGKTASLLMEGSETWQILKKAKDRGFL